MTHLQFPPSLYYLQDPFHHAPPPVGMQQHHNLPNSYPTHLLQQQTNFAFNFPFGAFGMESHQDVDERMEEDGRTNITHLYPEILTMIFTKLDLQSKGRVALVRTFFLEVFMIGPH